MGQDGTDIRDIFEANALIAGELTARAAVSASDAELAEFARIHRLLMVVAE